MLNDDADRSVTFGFRAAKRITVPVLVVLLASGLVAPACDKTADDDDSADDDSTDGYLDLSICDAANGPFTAEIDNPYLPFVVGSVHVLEGLEGGTEEVCFQIEVPDETAEVGGVTARVVLKRDCEDPDDSEREYFAQAPDGTVCIVGEGEDWEAGEEGYLAGIFMPGAPAVDMFFEMVHGPDGIEMGEITHLGVPFETPAGTFEDTLTLLQDGPSIKRYARDIGEIYDDGVILISY